MAYDYVCLPSLRSQLFSNLNKYRGVIYDYKRLQSDSNGLKITLEGAVKNLAVRGSRLSRTICTVD